jgi:hypothetical protein
MPRSLFFVVFVVLAFAPLGCSRDEPPPLREIPPASPSALASTLRVDASLFAAAPTDPQAPAGDLRAEIDRFTTLEACVAEKANVDPLLGDALRAIGYDTFVVDACRVLEASKTKDARRCGSIDATALRTRCEAFAAMVAGDADLCPMESASRPAFGRDALCVAVAARAPQLCLGADRTRRVACEAMLLRDPKSCDRVPSDAERAICKRDVARWSSVLPAPGEPPPLAKPTGKLVLHGAEGTAEPTQTEIDVTEDLARGVVVVDGRDGPRVTIGALREGQATFYAASPVTRPYVGVALHLPVGIKDPRIEHAELGMPGAAPLVMPMARTALKATVVALEAKRAGAVQIRLEGEMGSAPRGYKVTAELTTFVRDVVRTSAPLFPPNAPPKTTDGGAR